MKKDKALEEETWIIVRKCLKKIPKRTHGILHAERVYKNFQKLESSIKQKKNLKEILEALKYAVILHDIGNRDARVNHGPKSVIILEKEYKDFCSKLPNKKWVLYAIKHHSEANKIFRKYKNEPKKNKERWLCLAFLVLLDHMDSIGKNGWKKTKEYHRKELNLKESLCKEVDVTVEQKKVDDYINNPEKLKKLFPFRYCHPFLNILCNYYWIDKNLERVKDLLGKSFIDEYKKLKEETKVILRSYKDF